MLMRVMLTDFPVQYRKSYPDKKTATILKTRLESKLADFEMGDIIEGYELLTDQNRDFMPTIPALIDSIKSAEKHRQKKEQGNIEAERIAALPKPTISCNPVGLLKKAQSDINSKKELTMDEWQKRMHELRLYNNKLVASVGKRYADNYHLCNVNGCNKAGSLTSSVRGSETWYCRTHFSMS